MGAMIGLFAFELLAICVFGYLWLDQRGKRINAEAGERRYRFDYSLLLSKVEAKAKQVAPAPKSEQGTTPKPKLTGAQLRRMNEQENARFFEDRGELSNSELLKEMD